MFQLRGERKNHIPRAEMGTDQEMKVRSKWVNRWIGRQCNCSHLAGHTHGAGIVREFFVYWLMISGYNIMILVLTDIRLQIYGGP